MSYDYRIPQGRDKGKRTNGMFSLGGKLGSVLSALGNGEKLMQVRLWQNWEMVMGRRWHGLSAHGTTSSSSAARTISRFRNCRS